MPQKYEDVLRELTDVDVHEIEVKDLLDKARQAVETSQDADRTTEILAALYGTINRFQDQQAGKPDIEMIGELCEFYRLHGLSADIVRSEILYITELMRMNELKEAFDYIVDITPKVQALEQEDLIAKLNQITASLLLRENREKEAEPYIMKALDYFENSGDRREIMKTLYQQVVLQWAKGDYVLCRQYLQRILDDYLDLMSPKGRANAWSKMGNICNRQGENDEAIHCLNKARDISEQHNMEATLAGNLLTLGNVYMDNSNTELALECYQKAADIYEKVESKGGFASSLNNLGLVYMKMQESEKAREYYEKALGVYLQANLKRETVPLLNNLAIVCQHTKQITKAVDYVRLSYDIALEHGNKYEMIETINVMGYMLAEDAHDRKDIGAFEWIEERLEEGKKMAEEIKTKKLMLWCYRAHADVLDSKALTCIALNQPKEAYEVLRQSAELLREENALNERFNSESMAKKIEEVTAKLELKLKRKESEDLERINTDLKEANRRLMQQGNEMIDLERRNSALAMAVTANHEINQPLMVINGNLELLVNSLGERNLTEKEEVYLNRLKNSVRRIQKILEKYRESNQYVFEFYSTETKMVTLNGDKKTKES